MTDNKPAADVTKDWQATQGQKSAATRLRLFAALSWIVAIGGQIAGVVLLYQHKFDHGNLPLLIGILVGIAIFAIAGNLLWKAANRHDPARASDKFRFFFQNQLGVIITLIAFLPLVLLIFTDKNMDPQTKKVAGGVGAVLGVVATLIGVCLLYTSPSPRCAATSSGYGSEGMSAMGGKRTLGPTKVRLRKVGPISFAGGLRPVRPLADCVARLRTFAQRSSAPKPARSHLRHSKHRATRPKRSCLRRLGNRAGSLPSHCLKPLDKEL